MRHIKDAALQAYKKAVFETVLKSGSRVSEAQAEARIKICNTANNGSPCEFNGIVEPAPMLKVSGCTHCGCPFETKPKIKVLFGKEIKCPHPEKGNLWEIVDNNF